jgi:tetratricopeptide (TPR) repeat protein
MKHWQSMMKIGNQLFGAGDFYSAREQYLQALALAQVLFDRWANAEEAVAALVISHHNLADLHLRIGQPEEAAEYLCAVHEYLLQAAENPRLSAMLRDTSFRHSQRTYTELLGFISEHGQYPSTEYLLACSRITHKPQRVIKSGHRALSHRVYGES